MAETARFVWDLEDAIDEVVSFYASGKLREEGFSFVSPFLPWSSYWKRRSDVINTEYRKIKGEIEAAVSSAGEGCINEFLYTYALIGEGNEDASGGFTASGSTREEALQRGNSLKDAITAILRKRDFGFIPYVHILVGDSAEVSSIEPF